MKAYINEPIGYKLMQKVLSPTQNKKNDMKDKNFNNYKLDSFMENVSSPTKPNQEDKMDNLEMENQHLNDKTTTNSNEKNKNSINSFSIQTEVKKLIMKKCSKK